MSTLPGDTTILAQVTLQPRTPPGGNR